LQYVSFQFVKSRRMPILDDERLESFAWLLARDFTPIAAARACAFKARAVSAQARAARPEVAARVAEIRHDRERGGSDELRLIISRLIDQADRLAARDDLPSLNHARLLLNDAARLKALLPLESPPSHAACALMERAQRARLYV
jgi:hypothetical protein